MDDVPPFAKTLNNLTAETNLLSELKDVRDELSMIKAVLNDQQRVSRELSGIQQKLHRHGLPLLFKPTTPGFRQFIDHTDAFESLDAITSRSLQTVATVDAQAERFGQTLSELLELKQAHSNAFELEFSRQLSLDAAKQSRAVLVFTIVTIVFSPLSFVAAFFTMPLTNLPKETMTLAYVSKYIFILGFAVALPCIAIAFSVNKLSSWTFSWLKSCYEKPDATAQHQVDPPMRASRKSPLIDNQPDEVLPEAQKPMQPRTIGAWFTKLEGEHDGSRLGVDTKSRRRWRNERPRPNDSALPY